MFNRRLLALLALVVPTLALLLSPVGALAAARGRHAARSCSVAHVVRRAHAARRHAHSVVACRAGTRSTGGSRGGRVPGAGSASGAPATTNATATTTATPAAPTVGAATTQPTVTGAATPGTANPVAAAAGSAPATTGGAGASPVPAAPAGGVVGTPAAVTGGGLIVGLNANVSGWGGQSTAPRLDQVVSQTGTKWLREEFDWSTIEPSPGQYDFTYFDHFMLLAAQRGEHILPILYDTPAWAGASYSTIPTDTSAFSGYVSAVVARYGTNGTFWKANPTLDAGLAPKTWEVWNEPYYSTGDGNDYDPGAYANLVKAAALAGRAQDPNARFLLAADMQSARDAAGDWIWWVDALYQAVPNLNDYFDGVAVHPYGSTMTLNPIVYGQPYSNYGSVRRIEDVRNLFLAHGANKPFWITEAGWSTCSDSPICVTPAQDASDLSALFSLIHGSWSGWVQAAFIYSYSDGANASSTQGGYGLTYNDGSAKPVLSVFRSEAAQSAA